MKTSWLYPALLLLLLPACSSLGRNASTVAPSPDVTLQQAQGSSRYLSWGFYDLMIARDGSEYSVVPTRSAEAYYYWGYHLNAVKLLEVSPGKNCIKISKVNVLANGDLEVDISITHPYDNPMYTGFDVRGIIMFPSSQYIPDPDLVDDYPSFWHRRFASCRKGDAELMNPDGYTTIWAPDDRYQHYDYDLEKGYPIFGYYQGRMASGEDLGTINGFKRYHSNENRHMFEVARTVTRTFVIRPPAQGPIKASYAVYAHWAPPLVYPVANPATDFGPEANSPLPYEFWIEQIGPIDPDAPKEVQAENVLWHIKSWHFGIDYWIDGWTDLMGGGHGSGDIWLMEAFDKCPDCYLLNKFYVTYQPDVLPGNWPAIFILHLDPDGKMYTPDLATDFYISWLDIEAYDGEW